MIRVLPPEVVNQIAAGEVVERPFSVVKELVENSLDAGATRVHVSLEEGGRSLLRVLDDGCGFSAEDLDLAFVSHATSKLAATSDLDHIASLGFRGEALASIGSIARTTIRSRTADSDGHEIRCDGGKIEAVKPTACPPGTVIEVRDLFYNTPARRRFLKTPRAERARIQEMLARLGLARTDVDFTLECDGKEVLRLPAGESLRDRIGRVLGRGIAGALHAVDLRRDDISVRGFAADPDVARRDSTQELLYINGRLARDKSATHAIRQAYREHLMGGRYPSYVLLLSMPPDAVDVNVHPTKSEIRFLDGRRVCGLLHESVRSALAARTVDVDRGEELRERSARALGGASRAPSSSRSAKPTPRTGFPSVHDSWFGSQVRSAGGAAAEAEPVPPATQESTAGSVARESVPDSQAHPFRRSGGLESRRYLQLHDLYLVFEDDDGGMFVVDQHALHERVVYERLVRQHESRGEVAVQQLLVPEVIDLAPSDKAYLLDAKEALAEEGFLVDDFGGDSIAVQGVPAVLSRARPRALVESFLLGGPGGSDPDTARPRARDAILERFHSMACRSSVMSGDRLDEDAIRELLVAASKLEHPHNCPHGRPTVLRFSGGELERFFRRKL